MDDTAHQCAQGNIDKQQNNTNSNNNDNDNDNDNDGHHIVAQKYGTQATIVPTPNPAVETQLAGGKRSKGGYQPWPARCAAAVVISFYTPSKVHRSKRGS